MHIKRKIPNKFPSIGEKINKFDILHLKENKNGEQIVIMRNAQPTNKDNIKQYVIYKSIDFVCVEIIGYSKKEFPIFDGFYDVNIFSDDEINEMIK